MLLYILYLEVYIVYILMASHPPPPSSAYLVHGHSFMPLIHLFQVSIDRC